LCGKEVYTKWSPFNIILIRASVTENWDGYRGKAASIFIQRTSTTVKLILDSKHFYWDYPEVIVVEIR